MLAHREWRVRIERETLRPILQSMSQGTLWPDGALTADRVPQMGELLGSAHGVHAVLPEGSTTYLTRLDRDRGRPLLLAVGRVDAWGQIVGHDDGVIRAEHMRVLALRLVLLPAAEACPCGRLVVVQAHHQSSTLLQLRTPCEPGHCGTRLLGGYGVEPVRIAETTLAAVESSLLQRYEIERLPDGEGPWYTPLVVGKAG